MVNKNRTRKTRGGAATVLPLNYYNPNRSAMNASSGHDLLKVSGPTDIRPRIGGKRKNKRARRSQKGGFVPSIMEGFVASVSKYIVPVVLYAGYKLMTSKRGKKILNRKASRQTKRR
jgi:hypothetical protein